MAYGVAKEVRPRKENAEAQASAPSGRLKVHAASGHGAHQLVRAIERTQPRRVELVSTRLQFALVLRVPARMLNHVANLRQHVGKLHGIQLRRECSQLGDEGISERLVDLVLARGTASAQQVWAR